MVNKPVTVTIFGGTGFLGRYIIRRLAQHGFNIRVPTRHPNQASFLKGCGQVGQVVTLPCNIKDKNSMRPLIQGSDFVINLLGILFEKGSNSFEAIHHRAASDIAQLCQKLEVKHFVHVSAIGADEESDSAYARSKGLGENAVTSHFPTATILRPSLVFGPEDGFFNRFAKMSQYLPALPLIDGGKTLFQPVYVGDIAAAMEVCLLNKHSYGQIYELAGPKVLSFKQLLERMLEQTHQNTKLISIPSGLAMVEATLFELLPTPPLTRDQIKLLGHDNIKSDDMMGLEDLGVPPTHLSAILPTYLKTYQKTA